MFDDLVFQRPQLAQRLLDIDKLDLQRGDPLPPMGQREAHLLDLPVIDIVEVEEILDLRQTEAQPLAPADQRQPGAVTMAVDPVEPVAPGRQQPLVLVEADRAGSDLERVGQLADGKSPLFSRLFRRIGHTEHDLSPRVQGVA